MSALAGTAAVSRAEFSRLVATRRLPALLLLATFVPVLAAVLFAASGVTPQDSLLGRWVHESGFALPLLLLGYAGTWVLPLVAGLVAGELFTSEDQHGTWPLVLTRSRSTGEVFGGKVLAAAGIALLATAVTALASLLAGVLTVGNRPLVGLSGSLLPPGRATLAVLESWGAVLPPVLAFTALGVLSCLLARRTLLGLLGPAAVGVLLQLLSFVPAVDPVRPFLPTTAFASWHGLVRGDVYAGPVLTGTLVSAVFAAVCLAVGWRLLSERDVTEDA